MQSALPPKKLRSCFFYLLVLKTDRPVVRYQQISGLKGWSWGFWLSAIDENKEALWGGVQLLFFRSQTDLINKSNSLAIQAMAVCRREVFTILCKIYAYIPFHDPTHSHWIHTLFSQIMGLNFNKWNTSRSSESPLSYLTHHRTCYHSQSQWGWGLSSRDWTLLSFGGTLPLLVRPTAGWPALETAAPRGLSRRQSQR